VTGAKHSGTALAEFLRLTSASAGVPQALDAALLADVNVMAPAHGPAHVGHRRRIGGESHANRKDENATLYCHDACRENGGRKGCDIRRHP
jgi:hypothetical protein